MRRKDTIRYKLMPGGLIRAYQQSRTDSAGASEGYVTPPHACAPTIATSGHANLLEADRAILSALALASAHPGQGAQRGGQGTAKTVPQ